MVAYSCEPYTGSESAVGWNWAINLAKFVKVTVLTRRNNRPGIENYFKTSNLDLNIEFIYHDLKIFSKIKNKIPIFGNQFYYRLWTSSLEKVTANIRFDLVHHVSFMTIKSNYKLLYHNKSIVGPVGGLEKLNQNYLKHSTQKIYEKARIYMLNRFFNGSSIRNLSQITSIVLATNSYKEEIMKHNKNVYVQQIAVNYNPELRKIDKKKYIYWGGANQWWKGLDVFLRAIDAIDLEQFGYEVIITGPTIKNKNYLDKISKNKNAARISHHGFLDKSSQERLLAESKILAFTSLHETTGLMLLEGMAYGCAALVINTGGPAEIVDDRSGLKVTTDGSYEDLISNYRLNLLKLLEDEHLLNEISINAMKRIDENYIWDVATNRMLDIYEDTVN